jgi:hypothetical protein
MGEEDWPAAAITNTAAGTRNKATRKWRRTFLVLPA